MGTGPKDGIFERKDKNGKVIRYCFQIRKQGFTPVFGSYRLKTRAVNERNKTLAAMEEGRFSGVSEARKHLLKELIERYEKSYAEKINSAKQTTEIRWWKEQLGDWRLSDITSILIAEYQDRLLQEITVRKKPRSNGSVRRYLAALSHILSVAVKNYGWLQENPMSRVTKPKEPRGRVRFLSPEERERLLKACKESKNSLLFPVVVLALSTGMRQSEIMNLKWSEVDLQRGRIILLKTKNKEVRGVPIAGLALKLLKDLGKVRRIDTALLFPSYENPRKPMDLRFPWEKALKAANISEYTFHDNRHSAASELAMNGASLAEISEILGHKTLAMVKRYSHLSETHTSEVIARMNAKIFEVNG